MVEGKLRWTILRIYKVLIFGSTRLDRSDQLWIIHQTIKLFTDNFECAYLQVIYIYWASLLLLEHQLLDNFILQTIKFLLIKKTFFIVTTYVLIINLNQTLYRVSQIVAASIFGKLFLVVCIEHVNHPKERVNCFIEESFLVFINLLHCVSLEGRDHRLHSILIICF